MASEKSLFSILQYPTVIAAGNSPVGRGEHQQKGSPQRNSEREQFLGNDAVNV